MQSKQLAIAIAAAFGLAAPAFSAGDSSHRSQGSQDTMSQPSGASQSGMAAQSQGSESVRQAQQALKDKGYDTGPIDGIMGPKTSAALREFQQAQGIQASGRLDQQTLSALDVQSTGMSSRSGRDSMSRSTGGTPGPTTSSDATSPSPSSTQSGKTPPAASSSTQPASGDVTGSRTSPPSPSGSTTGPTTSSDARSPSPSSTESGKSGAPAGG
jgi:peptidoglycan hydrolase-like protein with peptidoglycan-binding domain